MNGTGEIRVHRARDWFEPFRRITVMVDGQAVARLRRGATCAEPVAAGEHVVAVKLGRSRVASTLATVTVDPGEVTEKWCYPVDATLRLGRSVPREKWLVLTDTDAAPVSDGPALKPAPPPKVSPATIASLWIIAAVLFFANSGWRLELAVRAGGGANFLWPACMSAFWLVILGYHVRTLARLRRVRADGGVQAS